MPSTVATWGGLDIQLVSEEAVAAIEAAKSFLEILNEALSIALGVGEIAKTFVTSNLNLARALVREILDQLRSLIQDLFSLGVYANLGDLRLLRQGTAGLKGGYRAYERRMLQRLNDRSDPNRPDYTNSATVLALFFYIGVDISFIDDLIDTSRFGPLRQLLRSFATLLGLSFDGNDLSLPVAVNLRAEYTSPDASTAQDFTLALSSLLGRTRIQIVWNTAPAPNGNSQDAQPTVPPCGFIVEVSCYPQGFTAAWIGPAPSGTGIGNTPSPTGGGNTQAFTTGQYQTSTTGQPLVIFGGEDAILIEPPVQWPPGFTPGTNLDSGSHPLYFYRDARTPEVIRKAFGKGPQEIENGQDVTPYYNQKRFFVTKAEAIAQGILNGNYSITLKETDLPWYCPIVNGEFDPSLKELPRSVYVRVIPVSNRVDENNFRSAQWKPQPWTGSDQTIVNLNPVVISGDPEPLGASDLGTPSEVVEIAIPNAQQNLYAQALQTALAIVTLSRSDLDTPDPVSGGQNPPPDRTYQPTGLESVATEISQKLLIPTPENYYNQRPSTESPNGFVSDLYPRISAAADAYIRTQGVLSQDLLDSLQPTLEDLVNWKWSDSPTSVASGNPALRYTILQSLLSTNVNTPLSRNRNTTRLYYSNPSGTPAAVLEEIRAKWLEGTFGITYHPTSLDSSPVIGPSRGAQPQYWFVRDLIPDEIYTKAATVLALTSSQTASTAGGTWVSKRLFAPRAPTGAVLTVLNKVDGFFNTLFAGGEDVSDGITRVIDFLEQRVREIQELIRRIETLLDIPYQISFPSAKVLVLITNGTSGIVSGLVSAREKPQEGPKAYAGGLVFVAGSAPSILIDIVAREIQSASGG